jgi:hypothetical protein
MGRKRNREKTGRNDPCPCQSGKKYKRCHGSSPAAEVSSAVVPTIPDDEIKLKIAEMQAMMAQQERQQGRGRPIVSAFHQGQRFVAVGKRLLYSSKWKTFHDFLFDYIKDVLGMAWGDSELRKPLQDRHPILQWFDLVSKHQESNYQNAGTIRQAPMTGAVAAYLGLAYNLYLLAHNVNIQSSLISRLRDSDQFSGAYYETYVAATFIKAGFALEFENEADISTTHCEFTATSRNGGDKYSVEAKARGPYKNDANVGNQLHEALRKKANHRRIVFIDVNVSEDAGNADSLGWVREAIETLKKKESSMSIQGKPSPPAYVVLTNHPYAYNLEKSDFHRAVVAEGFKIPEFSHKASFGSVREARKARDRHSDMFTLMDSIRVHYEIPATFDGEIPQFAFGEVSDRLKIGQLYCVPDQDGNEVTGELVDATVLEGERVAYGIYKLMGGRQIIVTTPLADQELAAYRRHPDSFFGVVKADTIRTDDPLELYDRMFSCYCHTPKEKLLEWMKDHPAHGKLKDMSEKELAIFYCESAVEQMIKSRSKTQASGRSD